MRSQSLMLHTSAEQHPFLIYANSTNSICVIASVILCAQETAFTFRREARRLRQKLWWKVRDWCQEMQ